MTDEFASLLSYANDNLISVTWEKEFPVEDGLSAYNVLTDEIVIGVKLDLNDISSAYIFAHELGHYFSVNDHDSHWKSIMISATDIMHTCILNGFKVPSEVSDVITQLELEAFLYADSILDFLKIEIPDSIKKEVRNISLTSYRHTLNVGNSWKLY